MMKRSMPRRLGVVAGTVLALALLTVGAALAAYLSVQTYTSKAAPEAKELSGLLASPNYPNWYWVHSDVWKTTDSFAACSGLVDTDLSRCQQVQRAWLWALRLDPVTHKVLEARSFPLAEPDWAVDPYIA